MAVISCVWFLTCRRAVQWQVVTFPLSTSCISGWFTGSSFSFPLSLIIQHLMSHTDMSLRLRGIYNGYIIFFRSMWEHSIPSIHIRMLHVLHFYFTSSHLASEPNPNDETNLKIVCLRRSTWSIASLTHSVSTRQARRFCAAHTLPYQM